jgi:hypothetical protein
VVEILWWLAPPVVATVLAMGWVTWLGREGRGQVDREVAVRRLGEAMSKPPPPIGSPGSAPRRVPPEHDRSSGVAIRPSQRSTGSSRRAS